jgi:hypothetical protein
MRWGLCGVLLVACGSIGLTSGSGCADIYDSCPDGGAGGRGCPVNRASNSDANVGDMGDAGDASDDSAVHDGGEVSWFDGPYCDASCSVPATLVIAHTAPGVPPFRVCFSEGATGTTPNVPAIPAIPDNPSTARPYPTTGPFPGVTSGTPGFYPGTVGAFPELGLAFQKLEITFFMVLSSSITNDVNYDGGAGINATDGGQEEDCVHLVGTHGLGKGDTGSGATAGRLTLGTDFFALPTIPAGTLDGAQTYLVSVIGCLPEGAPDPDTCGPDYDGGNTAALSIAALDTTTNPGTSAIGVQFAHRSFALENTPVVLSASDGGTAEIIHTPATDGVLPALITGLMPVPVGSSPVSYADAGPVTPTQLFATSANGAPTAFAVSVEPLDGGSPNASPWPGAPGAPGDVIALPLTEILALSAWSATTMSPPNGFVNGQTYTFILTGDPSAQPLLLADGGTNPLYDGRGVHLLAFPNSFMPFAL